ncbi:putative F-box protein At1g19160 [Rutidosis leptorrhynchoides]|uniref:putative F-box protein At1g19160 n=1 Tax=Rutidosis leptorrhynchoides TaxID=125765 RepID=UPI003A9A40BC
MKALGLQSESLSLMDYEIKSMKRKNSEIKSMKRKREKKINGGTGIGDVPEEILVEILIRLPAKSIHCSCRFVCKRWRLIIKTPIFCARHLTFIAEDGGGEEESELVIFQMNCDIMASDLYSVVVSEDSRAYVEALSERHPLLSLRRYYGFLGRAVAESYGLFCFFDSPTLSVCNPATKQIVSLPPIAIPFGPNNIHRGPPRRRPMFNHKAVAFGYDKISKKHKVIHAIFPNIVEIITLGGNIYNSWRSIPSIPPYCFAKMSTVCAHGDAHWLVFHDPDWENTNSNIPGMIMSFDFTKEEFVLIPHPPFLGSKPYNYNTTLNRFRLLKWRGSLALIYFRSTSQFETWVIKDYANKQWARLSITYLSDIGKTINAKVDYITRILATWKDYILFWKLEHFILYNPVTRLSKYVPLPPPPHRLGRVRSIIPGICYTASLVSIQDN